MSLHASVLCNFCTFIKKKTKHWKKPDIFLAEAKRQRRKFSRLINHHLIEPSKNFQISQLTLCYLLAKLKNCLENQSAFPRINIFPDLLALWIKSSIHTALRNKILKWSHDEIFRIEYNSLFYILKLLRLS